jgi:hypothetical protein
LSIRGKKKRINIGKEKKLSQTPVSQWDRVDMIDYRLVTARAAIISPPITATPPPRMAAPINPSMR